MKEQTYRISASRWLFTLRLLGGRKMRKERKKKQIKKEKQRRVFGEHMLRSKLLREASSVPGDANIRPDLCCRLTKSIIFTAHILRKEYMCVLCTVCIFMSVCLFVCILTCLCLPSKTCLSLTYTFITDSPEAPGGLGVGRQHGAADVVGSGQICRLCTLFETQHLLCVPARHLSPLLSVV